MKTLILRIVLALIGLFRARAAAKAAQVATEAERTEAAKESAAIREEIARREPGVAREALKEKWRRMAILLTVAGGVSACAAPIPVAVDTSCDWVRPILVVDADQITDATARDILAHNEAWKRRCKP